MTKQRKLIKDIIYASYKHPTAEEIYEMAKKKMSSIFNFTQHFQSFKDFTLH